MSEEVVYRTNVGEMYNRKTGVSIYEPEGIEICDPVTIYSELWLPNHSTTLVEQLKSYSGVTLLGEVGSGKSALLYGTRKILQAQETSYIFINGHFTNSEFAEVNSIIDDAQRKNMVIIYDSADYLVGANRKVRQLPLQKHLPRNIAIIEKLIEFRQGNGTLLLTSHHDNWINDIAHPDLIPKWKELVGHTQQTEVKISLETFEERFEILKKMGLSEDLGSFIAHIPDNPDFIDHIVNTRPSKKYITWAVEKLCSYQMLKLLCKDKEEENDYVLNVIRNTLGSGETNFNCWESILDFVYSKTYRTLFHTKL